MGAGGAPMTPYSDTQQRWVQQINQNLENINTGAQHKRVVTGSQGVKRANYNNQGTGDSHRINPMTSH